MDAAGAELGDLLRDDHSTATAVDLHVSGATLSEPLDEVGEVLDMAALVRRDGDALDVLLEGGGDDLFDAAVMAEVHDLDTLRLEQPAHDVDRRVVAVEQARRRDEPHRVHGHMQRRL